MAIRTLPLKERYSFNKSRGGGGGAEPRRKLKKLRSVKVANLDRLRLSMKRAKTRFVPGSPSSSESSSSFLMMPREKTRFIPGSSSSESSSSSPMSGTYSPNYMRDTTSSSARKASSFRTPEGRNIPSSRGKLSSRLSEASVEECSNPTGVNVPVDMKLGNRLKRAPSMKISNKLSSMKSMKIRAKYSQFPDVEINEFEDNVGAFDDQHGMIKVEPKIKGLLERSLSRSRSTRMMRLKSLRSSRRQKSRFSGGATVHKDSGVGNSNEEPHFMKATSAQQARKDFAKGLTRTSTLRPLRILAKISSLRPRRSKERKRPEARALPGVSVHRPTCSSVLKSSKFPDHTQVNSGVLEAERFSSVHVCPYNYCSLHGHKHHDPSLPLKEFVSAKRQLVSNQKEKQLENHSTKEIEHFKSVKEINCLEKTVDTESPTAKEIISNYQGEEDTGMDFFNNIYAKPRKLWEIEGSPREDAEASNLDYTDHNFGGYDWKLEDILGGTSRSQANQEALTETNIKSSDKMKQETIKFEVPDSSVKLPDSGLKSSLVDKTLVPLTEAADTQNFMKNHSGSLSTNSESSSGTLTNMLSDKQKYSSIWHLIYQQFAPSEETVSKDQENRGIGEREQGDANTVQEMNDLELRESKHGKNLDKDKVHQGASMEKTNFDQTAAINLVQQAVNTILEREAMPDQEMLYSPPGGQMEQVVKPNKGKMPGQKMSKNWSKLRKIIVTAKCIKAMENLIRISPGKPRFLLPEPTSEEERVYLRHLSMNERKYEEEWMLDFALRKVLSRLAPDQQRRVGLLVEAFETFGLENKEMNVKSYPEKQKTAPGIRLVTSMVEDPKQLTESTQGVSIPEEQIPKKPDDIVPLPVYLKGTPEGKNPSEEASATGDKILQEADVTSIFSESPSNSSTSSVDRGFEETSLGSKEGMSTLKAGTRLQTGDLAVYPAGDMVLVLFDKQKYSSMWNMIYEHVVSNEESREIKQEANGLDEKNEGYNVNTCDDDLDSTPRSYSTDHEEDEDERSVFGEKQKLSKSAAVKLVREAVNAIIQSYGLPSNQQSIKDHNTASDNVKELVIQTPTNSNEENSGKGSKRLDTKETHPEANVSEKTSDARQKQVEANESNAPPKRISKSLSKLRKAIVTTKFIKAMEKLRKINPQKPRHLLPEAASEEEKVNLRHLSMDGKKNEEEWMLDYALRKVISKLDPEQQRRVALLVEAFETVTPEQKAKGIKFANLTNKEPIKSVNSEQQRSILVEQVLQKQDEGFLASSEGIPKQRRRREAHKPQNHQANTAGGKTKQKTGKTAVSSSTTESSVTHEELSTGDEEMTISELGSSPSVKRTTLPEPDNSTSNEFDEHINPNADYKSSQLGKVIWQERSPIENDSIETSNFKTKLHEENLDSSLKGYPFGDPKNALRERKESDLNSKYEPLPEASLGKDTEQDCEGNMTQATFSDTQKHMSMWHLIYQHAKPATAVGAGSSLSEIVASKDRFESGSPSSVMTVDGETDDSDTSSVTSELGESDAVKLIREAIKDILVVPQELDNEVLSSNTAAAFDEDQRAGREEQSLSRGFSKLRKLILCNKFIKAMEKEKMQKSNAQKRKNQSLNSNPEAVKATLKRSAVGETRKMGELMLDRALQKVIVELAPVQQRRVALLVKAFEKVNPDIEETGKGFSSNGTESLSSASHAKGKNDRSQVPGDSDLELQGSVTGSSREVATDSSLEEIQREDWRNNSSSSITAPTSNVCKDSRDIHPIDIQICPIQQKLTLVVNNTEPSGEAAENPSQPEDLLEDEENPSTENHIAVDKVRHTSLWRLLVQHVNSDILDESEIQKTGEIDASGEPHCAGELLGKDTNYPAEIIHDEDINVQMSRSRSFEIQEREAIKVVQEALNEILTCDDQSMTTSTTSDQDGCTENHGFNGESSFDTEEIEGVHTSVSSVVKPKEEQELAKEESSIAYSQLSKVILCKRFTKAMNKMRKLKAQSPQDHMQNLQSEEKIVPMRQTPLSHRKNWEEWMLDRAMQQVVGKLAPVQKKKVSLLVQAFEKVSSQPELSTAKKGQAAGL